MPEPKRFTFSLNPAVIFLVATASVGAIAIFGLFTSDRVSEGQALCLVAAALAFGMVSNALMRP